MTFDDVSLGVSVEGRSRSMEGWSSFWTEGRGERDGGVGSGTMGGCSCTGVGSCRGRFDDACCNDLNANKSVS